MTEYRSRLERRLRRYRSVGRAGYVTGMGGALLIIVVRAADGPDWVTAVLSVVAYGGWVAWVIAEDWTHRELNRERIRNGEAPRRG